MLRWADTGEDLLDMVANEVPDGRRIQLLRSTGRPELEQGRDTHQRLFGLAEMRMQSGERDRRLPGVFGLASDRGHQPRPAGEKPRGELSDWPSARRYSTSCRRVLPHGPRAGNGAGHGW